MTIEQDYMTTEQKKSQKKERQRLEALWWAGALIWAGLVFGADSLGRVFYHKPALLGRQINDRVHVRTLAIQMNRHYRLNLGRRCWLPLYKLRQPIGGEVVGVRVNVDENRPGPEPGNHARGSEERIGRRQDDISRADIQCHQCDQKRVSSRGNPHSVARATVLGNPGFQLSDFWSIDKHAGLDDLINLTTQLLLNVLKLSFQVQ